MKIAPIDSWVLEIGVIAAAWQVKAALLLIVVLLVQRALSDSSAAFRRRVWAAGLTAALLLPVLGSWLPRISLDVPYVATVLEEAEREVAVDAANSSASALILKVPTGLQAADASRGDDAAADARPVVTGDFQPASPSTLASPAGDDGRSWLSLRLFFTVIAIAWALGVLVRLAWLAYENIRVRVRFRDAVPLPAGRIARVAEDALRFLPRWRRVRLVVSPSDNVLCTYGLLRPVIVLPAGANDWPDDRLRVAILHEAMHIRAFDYLGLLLSEIACAIYWPNPLVWHARSRLQAEQEEACDAQVIHCGVRPVDYASHLVEIARLFHASPYEWRATLPLARCRLESRVLSILQKRGLPPGVPATAWSGVALLLASIVVPVSMLHPGREPAPIPSQPVALPFPEIVLELPEVRDLAMASASAWELPPLPAVPPIPVSTVAEPLAGIGVQRASFMWLEAEDLVTNRRLIEHDRGGATSGGNYVTLATERRRDSGALVAAFDVAQAGPHYLWARVRQVGRRDGGLQISVDGGELTEWNLPRGRDVDRGEWFWVRLESGRRNEPRPIELGIGSHQIRISAQGADVDVDGVVIAADPTFIPRGAPPMVPPEQPVHIWLAADNATWSEPFVIDQAEEGFRFLHVDTRRNNRDAPPTNASAVFRFDVAEAGIYLVWARTLVRRSDGDSFWVRVNNGPWIAWDELPRDRNWQWSEVRHPDAPGGVVQFPLHAGENTIEFALREGGPRLDRVLVTNDPRFIPRSRGTPTQTAARDLSFQRDPRTS
ncbi:MAG TPA: M56 family metallopeptidase [Longimicrobiales bacterium]|nr:M56 family metallopeptidase [Longimicrobiales bacterium]